MKSVLILLTLLSTSALADIYRWTDENGKVHFSDKPPRDQQAENISHTTKNINIDSSSTEQEKVGKVFAPPTPEEKFYQEQQAQGRTQQQLAKQATCDKLKKELRFFQTERFYWVDEEGKANNAKESERDEMIGKLEKAIRENC